MTSLIVFGAVVLFVLYAMAHFVHDWSDSKRARKFEEHQDEMMDTITEMRIRRNFNQGG
jgi:amino acid permease